MSLLVDPQWIFLLQVLLLFFDSYFIRFVLDFYSSVHFRIDSFFIGSNSPHSIREIKSDPSNFTTREPVSESWEERAARVSASKSASELSPESSRNKKNNTFASGSGGELTMLILNHDNSNENKAAQNARKTSSNDYILESNRGNLDLDRSSSKPKIFSSSEPDSNKGISHHIAFSFHIFLILLLDSK